MNKLVIIKHPETQKVIGMEIDVLPKKLHVAYLFQGDHAVEGGVGLFLSMINNPDNCTAQELEDAIYFLVQTQEWDEEKIFYTATRKKCSATTIIRRAQKFKSFFGE